MSDLKIELYKKLYLIRRAEEKIIEYYHEDQMKTPMHMSMGEEAIAVGICHALKREDQVFGTYRSHAVYLAKTQDIDDFFAEMYGKATAQLKGKGGSMHLCAPEYGFMGTSAIVGSIIPVAAGAAFANKIKKNGKVTTVFFGDGALDEGAFWESINVSCLMRLPILFVCEDNGLAEHTPVHERHGYDSISEVISKFNCRVFKEKSADTEAIYKLTTKAINLIRTEEVPCFLHLKYYRYLEHVGVNKDFEAGYRSKDEFEEWHKQDPIITQREKLKGIGFKENEIKAIEIEINRRIDDSISKAKKAPFAKEEELYEEVFG